MKAIPRAPIRVALITGLALFRFCLPSVARAQQIAPANGVGTVAVYTNRIGEPGTVIAGGSVELWTPVRYEPHATVIHAYLTNGYHALTQLFGDYQTPYWISVEHYPNGSPYNRGGTDARGGIFYGYANVIDDSTEWNVYGVPHVSGYCEEMAHCFVHDFGLSGFYEALGLMLGEEAARRTAWNPHLQSLIDGAYATYADTTAYYRDHNAGPPGVADNIWPTRVLGHLFKTEVVNPHGWDAFARTFADLRAAGFPLRDGDPAHSWGGFLDQLSITLTNDFHAIFASNGLPRFSWTGEAGFESDGVEPGPDGVTNRFRVRCFDANGDAPATVRAYVYDGFGQAGESPYALTNAGGNAAQGWIYETTAALPGTEWYRYAFAATDGRHTVFQAVGVPTVPHQFASVPPVPAARAWQIGTGDNSSAGFDGVPHDDLVTVRFAVGDAVSNFPSTLGTDIGPQRSVIQVVCTNVLDWGGVLVLRWSPGGSAAQERFRVSRNGAMLWESRKLAGSSPYRWYTEHLPLVPATATNETFTLTHLQGDGLVLDFLGLMQITPAKPPRFAGMLPATPGEPFELRWLGELGRRYRVLHTTNLLQGFPDVVVSNLACSNLPAVYVPPAPPDATPHYYRVSAER